MIIVKLNKSEFEYDIHSLVKAFFPEENVSVTAEEKHYDEAASWMFRMDYREDGIAVEWRSFPISVTSILFHFPIYSLVFL